MACVHGLQAENKQFSYWEAFKFEAKLETAKFITFLVIGILFPASVMFSIPAEALGVLSARIIYTVVITVLCVASALCWATFGADAKRNYEAALKERNVSRWF